MADVWRSQIPRAYRKTRALGTIDGRLVEASPVTQDRPDPRPRNDSRNVQFNAVGTVVAASMSPPYVVTYEAIIVSASLSVESGGVKANIYVNGSKKLAMSHSGSGGYTTLEDLDIGVDVGDEITVSYDITSGAPVSAVTTVTLLED